MEMINHLNVDKISKIAFLDTEVVKNSGNIFTLGLLFNTVEKTTTSITAVKEILEQDKPDFICGHNFIDHDKKFLSSTSLNTIIEKTTIIDTLLLSMLLFPNKITHKLEKPYKTTINIENQPLGDAIQTKVLFLLLDKQFDSIEVQLRDGITSLLHDDKYFIGYFKYKNIQKKDIDIYEVMKEKFSCSIDEFKEIQKRNPVELAFVLSYLCLDSQASISYVILKKYPKVLEILKKLTFNQEKIDLEIFAEYEFGIPSFREFDKESIRTVTEEHQGTLFEVIENKKKGVLDVIKGVVSKEYDHKKDEIIEKNKTKISQRDIISNALNDTSLLVILPTGGGKTFTFQMPALIKAKAYKGLTVVISPLQALMKNHVDSFKEKNQNFKVEAISGYLSPIERMNIIAEVENGVVDILYLAPEALRSNTIFNALKRRAIERFVIDEAHCFSSWGHDFRHDYYFVSEFIKSLEAESEFQAKIPVSCFTATAKPEVLKDIKEYFSNNLGISLKEFIASSARSNLEYRAVEVKDNKEKYEQLIKELLNIGKSPTIIYIPQNARECKELREKLNVEIRLQPLDLVIEPFYSKIDDEIESGKRVGRNKSEILNDFIENKIDIVIATTAFGMGIDKPDIQTVIHYEQSDSLEAYLQESGRGARDERLRAQCIVLYSKDDFNRTFNQLNHSKLEYHEIERVVQELKKIKKDEFTISPRDIAQKMGIDTEDSSVDYDLMIKTALLELEHAEVIKRGRNSNKIFATSIDKEKRSMEYVHEVLDPKKDEYTLLYNDMITVMNNIIQRSKVDAVEVDELADIVGIHKLTIFNVLYALQKEKLLAYNNDISIHIKKSVINDFKKHFDMESSILEEFKKLPEYQNTINLRDINSLIGKKNSILTIKKIIQSWTHLSKLKENMFNARFFKSICYFECDQSNIATLENVITIRKKTCEYIVDKMLKELGNRDEAEVEVSTNKLKDEFDIAQKISLKEFHHYLVYLHELIESFKLSRGRLIYYQAFKIHKEKEFERHTPYRKNDHYNISLKPYYKRKIEAVHIQMYFLERLIEDGWSKTSNFVKDYFGMDYKKFKQKYKLNDKEIQLPITKEKLEKILEDLNPEQKIVFDDKKNEAIMVLAGPGSGKTKTLVHKIASLVTIEDYKAEYFLMLAHSRVAVAEFKERLYKLIGSLAYDMKIYTFHAFAVELLGQKIDSSLTIGNVIPNVTAMIENGEIKIPYLQMLVLDEYQDVGANTYKFIKAIYAKMSNDKKIIAVGDDDQTINDFGNDRADVVYIKQFCTDFEIIKNESNESSLFENKTSNFAQYELLTNYRSKRNIVDFSNLYSRTILMNRLKGKELISHEDVDGYIELIRYSNSSYIHNIVENVSAQIRENREKNIAILARNNDEILTIYSQLDNKGINVKYITSKDGFNLGNLIELQDFISFWENSDLESAQNKFHQVYSKSKNYPLAASVIKRFIDENDVKNHKKYFISLYEQYLQEVTFDEFEVSHADVIVSTMHKSKGKEFESVYVCLDHTLKENNMYDQRLLYVAMTRAKNKLFIHSKNNFYLDFMTNYCNSVINYTGQDPEPERIVYEMSLGDISLSNPYSADGIKYTNPIAGEKVDISLNKYGYYNIYKNNKQIASLSKVDLSKPDRLSCKINEKKIKGYILENKAEIAYVVNWQNPDTGDINRQVLCKVYMSKIK
jgi:ATP-dependent DNA helicase RecQ